MKFLFVLVAMFSAHVFADDAQTVGLPAPAVVAPVIPQVAVQPAAIVSAPVPPSANAVVPVAAPSAPPAWLQNLLVFVQGLPIIGPYAAKAFVYVSAISALLTSLVAFLLAALTILSKVFGSVSGLQSFSALIEEFKEGQIMYWLTYLSNFNAQKPDDPPA